MTKLSETQLTLLAATADAVEGTTAASHPKTIASLIKDGLLISVPRADGPSRLMITTKGRAALTPQAGDTGEPGAPETITPAKGEAAPAPAPKGKIAGLVALLRQPGGTTLEVMITATGWQAHSVRGAMSGAIKKGMGLTVISEKTEAGRRYRIEAAVAA
jgi:Protein of unknown function (DUF3489)